MMKKGTYILVLWLWVTSISAQQDQLYTQFGYNKLSFNPAYAGQDDYLSITAIYRDQWNGFPGAPEAQQVSVNLPRFKGNAGFGVHLERQSIGVSKSIAIHGSYAYKLRFSGDRMLSLGVMPSLRNLVKDFSDPRLVATEGVIDDPAVMRQRFSKNLFNVGLGTYYNHGNYYLGISVPRILRSSLEIGESGLGSNNEVWHYYIMGGAEFPINKDLSLTPQVLIRKSEVTPLTFDFNVGVKAFDKYNLSATYRSGGLLDDIGESLAVTVGISVNKQFLIGFSNDFSLSEINQVTNGSIELLLYYRFVPDDPKKKVANPRFF